MEGVCAYWVWVKILYTIPTILRGKGMDGVCAYWVGVKILYIILTILRGKGVRLSRDRDGVHGL
jgi:hypothetical protein